MSTLRNTLPVLALALAASACAPNTSTVGQRITCETDPDSGVILSCQPGEGDDDGDADSCEDIDEDGDGQPEDSDDADDDDAGSGSSTGGGVLLFTEGSDDDSDDSDDSTSETDCDADDDGVDDGEDDDDDNDGIDDDDDCDEQEGEDGDEADLPYDIEMDLGQAYTPIADAFAERGAQPEAILSVEMDGGGAGWRLAELQAGATFTVTDADCAHAGNRDAGRDRVIVTWRADGHVESDHLDLRYCEE